MRFATAITACVLALAGCGSDDGTETSPTADRFDADRAMADVEAQVALGPRPSGSEAIREQAQLIASELREAGAKGVRIQRPWRNIVATIPGTTEGTVVVGAHHDTKDTEGFVGANDGASGVAVVLELARGLAADAPLQGPSISLALFDAEEARGDRSFEEDGTRGSRQYVDDAETGAMGTPDLDQIQAMVLFDMVGDCDLQIPRESNSDPGLYGEFSAAAASLDAEGDAAPFEGETTPIGDDHVPFLEAGIPAVDLIDFTFGGDESPGPFWHTTEDTVDKVCPESLDAVGEAAVVALGRIGR